MAKFIAQIIVLGSQLIGRAFTRAVREEIQASQEAAKRLGRSGRAREHIDDTKLGLSLEEAKQILNVNKLDPEEIQTKFTTLWNANDKSRGGSFYLQSKVYRAKERLEYEIQKTEPEQQQSTNGSVPPSKD